MQQTLHFCRIWQHLVDIVRGGEVSVIITTHYIEEARQANTVRYLPVLTTNLYQNSLPLLLKYKDAQFKCKATEQNCMI